jgi:hypothetical protein
VCLSLSLFFSVSRHIPGPAVCISHFPSFSVLLAIFQVLQWVCLILHVFNFLTIFSFLQSAFLIIQAFQYSRNIPWPTVCVSHFPCFSVFLDIFQVLQCVFLIFHVFQFSCYIPGLTVCISHFQVFQCFSP